MTSSASASTDIQVSRDQSAEDDTEHSARQIHESSESDGSNGDPEEEMRMDESSEEHSRDGDVEEDDGSADIGDVDGSGDDRLDRDDEEEHMDTDVDTDGTINDENDSSSDEECKEEYKRYLNRTSVKEPGHDTPLHNAAENGHLQIVKMLLHSGIDINTKGKYECTALHLAAKKAHSEVISLLIDKGADVNAEDLYKSTALHLAAKKANSEVISLLVNKGADVSAKDLFAKTVLHLAAKKAPREAISLLIDKGADVNAEDFLLRTPLHIAVMGNNTDVVKYLIEQDADVDKRQDDIYLIDHVSTDGFGWSPLFLAVRYGFIDLVDLMVSKTAHINMDFHGTNDEDQSHYIFTCLGYAVKSGNYEMVKSLLEKGANVNEGGDWSPLHIAVKEDKFNIVQLLLSYNPKVDALVEHFDDYGYEYVPDVTPLGLAAEKGQKEIVKILLKHDAHVDVGACTPLWLAAWSGQIQIIEILLMKNPSIDKCNPVSCKAIDIKCVWSHTICHQQVLHYV